MEGKHILNRQKTWAPCATETRETFHFICVVHYVYGWINKTASKQICPHFKFEVKRCPPPPLCTFCWELQGHRRRISVCQTKRDLQRISTATCVISALYVSQWVSELIHTPYMMCNQCVCITRWNHSDDHTSSDSALLQQLHLPLSKLPAQQRACWTCLSASARRIAGVETCLECVANIGQEWYRYHLLARFWGDDDSDRKTDWLRPGRRKLVCVVADCFFLFVFVQHVWQRLRNLSWWWWAIYVGRCHSVYRRWWICHSGRFCTNILLLDQRFFSWKEFRCNGHMSYCTLAQFGHRTCFISPSLSLSLPLHFYKLLFLVVLSNNTAVVIMQVQNHGVP